MPTPRSISSRRPDRRTASEVRATAFHEAGHAVVSIYFGLPINEVSIVAQGDAFGHVIHPTPLALDFGTQDRLGQLRKQAAREQILAAYAGLPAQRLVHPNAPDDVAASDVANVYELSWEYRVLPRYLEYFADDYHQAYLERLRRESVRLVSGLRQTISDFADILVQRRRVVGEDAASTIADLLPVRAARRT